MKNNVRGFRELRVWSEAIDLAVRIYETTASFPIEERFGLAYQLRKSGVSIPSNIAEGNARATLPDDLRHLSISRGSLAEAETQIEIARRVGLVPQPAAISLIEDIGSVTRQLQSLINALQRKRNQ